MGPYLCAAGPPARARRFSPTRLVMDVKRLPDGRLEGTLRDTDADQPVGFSGTLELLKVLEDTLGRPTDTNEG